MKVLFGPSKQGLERILPDLSRQYPQVEFAHCADAAELPRAIADADVYFGALSRSAFLAAKKLAWIQSPSTGVNLYLDIPELVASDVLLTSAGGTHAACVAESALAMILSRTRGIGESVRLQQERRWTTFEVRAKCVELTGSTLGIIGLGKIGRALARRAYAFDMRIVAVDLCPADKPADVAELWGLERLDDLLRVSDYVVVTVPYTPETQRLIGAAQIALMKPSAMLVGISRGGIIDQVALAQALREKRLGAAALDVCELEPLPAASELWGLENLLITPHIAGGTQLEDKWELEILTENLGHFMRGERPLRNQIDKRRGF